MVLNCCHKNGSFTFKDSLGACHCAKTVLLSGLTSRDVSCHLLHCWESNLGPWHARQLICHWFTSLALDFCGLKVMILLLLSEYMDCRPSQLYPWVIQEVFPNFVWNREISQICSSPKEGCFLFLNINNNCIILVSHVRIPWWRFCCSLRNEYVFLCIFLTISLKLEALYIFPKVLPYGTGKQFLRRKKEVALCLYILCDCDKIFQQKQFKEKRLTLALNLRGLAPSWQEAARHTASTIRGQRAVAACCSVLPCPIYAVQNPSQHTVQSTQLLTRLPGDSVKSSALTNPSGFVSWEM